MTPTQTAQTALTIFLFVLGLIVMIAIIIILCKALFSDSEMDEDTRLHFRSWHKDNIGN